MNKFRPVLLGTVGVALFSLLAAYLTVSTRFALSEDFSLAGDIISHKEGAADGMMLPRESQTFLGGDYRLVVSTSDSWQTPTAIATLYKEGDRLWQKKLPHQYGPRFALVAPAGQVVLLDEYINVASDHAITLINSQGRTVVTYSFEDIHRSLQDADSSTTRADIANEANYGWWISAPPFLSLSEDNGGGSVYVETAGTAIQIQLSNGTLTPSPS